MSRRTTLQTNFSAGELSPDLGMRQDTDQYQNGAKSLRNRRCLIGGGTKRRPGTWYQDAVITQPRFESFVVSESVRYVLAFRSNRVDAYRINNTDGTLTAAGTVAGTPWSGDIYSEMDYEQSGDTAFLFHPDMPIQVLTRTSVTTWTRAAFTFFSGTGGRTEQPYFKVAADAVTLRPSALTGSITLQMFGSANVFTADDIGSIFRYVGREILITAVTDGNTATGTVVEKLPETQDLTVAASADFAVGELVAGATSFARGIVTSIPDATSIFVVISDGLTPFQAEQLVGPNAVTTISSVAVSATKASVKDWDEQLFSATNGYPARGVLHRNRLLLAGHPAIPEGLIGSKLNNLYSFDVGDGSDADGIFETIGDAGASEIVGLHSAEQLLVATDNGLYYCPESVASPFRPSSIAFFPFGSRWPITPTAKARSFDNGVLFVSASVVIKARPTGNQAQQWDADEVSLLASHLISNPTRIAVTSNFGGGPERYAALMNNDGTLAMMQLVEAQKIRNFTPWDTNGNYIAVCAVGEFLYVSVARDTGSGTAYFIEVFDQDITLDAASEYADYEDAGIAPRYGGLTINVVVNNQYHLGTWPLALTDPPTGPYTIGVDYEAVLQTLPPALDDPEGPAAGDLMRIVESYVHVIGSQRFAAGGYELQAYQAIDDLSLPPPVKSGPQRFQFLGWRREPTITITQPDPLPLDILAVRSTVAF